MPDRYEYTEIDEISKQFAIKELNENPLQVNAHIESFRRWVKSMPHIKCPTDSKFLLRFLRVAKFDHQKAERRLDNFCTMRSSVRGAPSYFKNVQSDDPMVQNFLNMKIMIPLGKTDDGQLFVLYRLKEWNPDTFSLLNFVNMTLIGLDILIFEEEIQIFGLSFLMDLDKINPKAIEYWSNPKFLKTIVKIAQDSYPMRLRNQFYFKEPLIFDIIYKIVVFFLKSKLANRIHRIKNDLKKATKLNPGLEKLLPIEYNGSGGTLEECSERWNERFKKFCQTRTSLLDITVDESKRPQKTLGYLKEHPEYNGETIGNFKLLENS